MYYTKLLFISLLFFSCSNNKKISQKFVEKKVVVQQKNEVKTIEFPSKDGLTITADLYEIKNPINLIILCHQASFSRGEYINTAQKLNKLGYSCLAIDQRSGKFANNINNETAIRANAKGLATKFLDARQDIEAAIEYGYKINNNKPIILVGSSYSASLVLIIATDNSKVKAVASFSPGEYLKDTNVSETIKKIKKPIFVTSSKKEINQTATIVSLLNNKHLTHYKPVVTGIHGSRALWNSTEGNEDYWNAFTLFLQSLKYL